MKQNDIADALNLSKTTVSRALSGKGRISEDTKKKINDYIESEKRKEKAAREDSLNLCVAIPGEENISSNSYFSECLFGVCEAASGMNVNVLVVKYTENDISEIVKAVEKKSVDGIILTRNTEHDKALTYLLNEDFPVAVAGHCLSERAIQVDIDNERAAEELTGILITRGYKKFTAIIENLEIKVNQSRYDGFLAALGKRNISFEKQYVYNEKLSTNNLTSIADNVLNRRTDCIICGDDEVAVKVMSWLKNEGYHIPKDVAIASFSNSTTLGVVIPPITAIDVPARTVGAMLARQMINRLEGRAFTQKTEVDYEILVRKSTMNK